MGRSRTTKRICSEATKHRPATATAAEECTMKRELNRCYRARGLSMFLLLVLAGCGGGSQPGLPAPQKGVASQGVSSLEKADTPEPSEKSPAVEGGTTTPVSAREAARIIDLRTFPRLDGAQVQSQ